jgi:hypothetical protein
VNKLCLTLLALIFISGATFQTLAVEKQGTTAPGPKPPTNAPPTAPLTEDDCKALNGSVSNSTVCESGLLCTTTDNAGTHERCISAK